jgi:hypothetical protein
MEGGGFFFKHKFIKIKNNNGYKKYFKKLSSIKNKMKIFCKTDHSNKIQTKYLYETFVRAAFDGDVGGRAG